MIDIKSTREEIVRIHAEASQFAEQYAETNPSAEDQAAQDERFAKLEKLQHNIETAEKLAKFAYTGDRSEGVAPEVKRPHIVLPSKSKDEQAVEAYNNEAVNYGRAAIGKAIGEWIYSGQMDDAYATITTASANGLLLPRVVTEPLVLTRSNSYRVALAAYGDSPITEGNTADVSTPTLTADSGGPISEDESTNTDASPVIGAILLKMRGFQSGTAWFSNLQFKAVDYDFGVKTRPVLASAKDHGFAKTITAAIKADTNVTATVSTPTTTTASIDNLDDAVAKISTLYSQKPVLILGTAYYNAVVKLKDTAGFPIMSRNDIQGQTFLAYKGTPVFKDDTLDATGTAGNLVGLAIGMDGFKLRDESEELYRYDNDANRPGKTGLNLIGYHAFGYVPEAIVKILN